MPAACRAPRMRAWAPLLLALVLLASLLPRLAAASPPVDSPVVDSPVVIGPGREHEILALFVPHALGDELSPGWTLHSFKIDVSTIEVWIAGPDEVYAQINLDHPEAPLDGARALEGFALTVVSQPAGSEAAVADLLATIERNDDGSFWAREVVHADETGEGPDPARPSAQPSGDAGGEAGGEASDRASPILAWAKDGILLLAAFTIMLLALTVDKLRGAQAWMKWTLVAIVLASAALRVGLSPEAPLAPWSYTRFLISSRLIYEGPLLALLHPDPVWMTELIMASTLVLALLAPLAVYVHARYLLDDHRAALIVAGILAFLPLHLRFAHTDVAFIPSITVSSFVFTLMHIATRERRAWLGWLAVALIGFPLALVYLVRPLNIMYFPLLLGTVLVDRGLDGDKPRVDWWRFAAAGAIMTAVTVLGGIPWLLASFDDNIREGLQLATLLSAARVALSPTMNMLLNPTFTPPGLTVLAVLGVVDLWRRRKRALMWFLVLWLLGFLAAHAYFVPMSAYMQARYHLHLIVPFMLLAACGFEAVLRALVRQRERWAWLSGRGFAAVIAAMIVYVAASPLLHLHAIRHVEFNEIVEWRFVHAQREVIPAQCSIIEFVGMGADSRFDRVGAYVQAGVPHRRWTVHEVALSTTEPLERQVEPVISDEVRALLDDPPACLYWYEGLPCVAFKPPELAKAPACERIEGALRLEEIAATSFASAPYDETLTFGLGGLETIDVRLFRAYPPDD